MRAAAVIEIEIPGQLLSGGGNSVVSMQIDFFVFHRFPEAFDEHVIAPAALAIHADPDTVLFKRSDENRTGELAALVGVHDLRRTVFQNRFFQRLDARVGGQ